MSFRNVLTRLYDAFSSVLIGIMTLLCDTFSFILIIYLLEFRKQTRWRVFPVKTRPFLFILFICLCFTLKPALVLQRILLIIHVLFLLVWENKRFLISLFHKLVICTNILVACELLFVLCIYIYIYKIYINI